MEEQQDYHLLLEQLEEQVDLVVEQVIIVLLLQFLHQQRHNQYKQDNQEHMVLEMLEVDILLL